MRTFTPFPSPDCVQEEGEGSSLLPTATGLWAGDDTIPELPSTISPASSRLLGPPWSCSSCFWEDCFPFGTCWSLLIHFFNPSKPPFPLDPFICLFDGLWGVFFIWPGRAPYNRICDGKHAISQQKLPWSCFQLSQYLCTFCSYLNGSIEMQINFPGAQRSWSHFMFLFSLKWNGLRFPEVGW